MSKKNYKVGDVLLDDNMEYVVISRFVSFNLTVGYEEDIPAGGKLLKRKYKVTRGKVDNYTGYVLSHKGKVEYIIVGCRVFTSLDEARKHWSNGPDGHHYKLRTYKTFNGFIDVDVYGVTAVRYEENNNRLKATEKFVARALRS